MIRPPAFWHQPEKKLLPALLSPISVMSAAITARRTSRSGWRAPVPVICCGNIVVGGAGKTTLALDLGRRLQSRGLVVHFLLRGFGGSARVIHRVAASDTAALVGDEALLLAEIAPTWIGADRASSAKQAISAGAEVLVLDDGLQNPTLAKDLSLLVVDGGYGFGNGRVLPAGPLREPIRAGAKRCQAAVLIGEDQTGTAAMLTRELPVLRARLVAGAGAAALRGRRVLAFAGIARPEKFFATVVTAGANLVEQVPFADHASFSERSFRKLLNRAIGLNALAVTTAKDAARLTPEQRVAVHILEVNLMWDDANRVETLLDQAIARRNTFKKWSMSSSSL